MKATPPLFLGACAALLSIAPAAAQQTTRISVDSNGNQGNGYSYSFRMTPDGRYFVFSGGSSNLVAGDTNGVDDVFVHDRTTGTTERVSISSAGVQGNSTNTWGVITPDGRYVAFYAKSDNLVPGDTNFNSDVFVHDRVLGTTVRASVSASGTQGNDGSLTCAISANGRFVAFKSSASNLVVGDTNGQDDIFVKDMLTGAVERVSVASGGGQGNANSQFPDISADGNFVVFMSDANNLVVGDSNPSSDVFHHDRSTGITRMVHADSAGIQGNGAAMNPTLSADGRRVAFTSTANNLVAGDTNGNTDVFVRDLVGGQTVRASISSSGVQGNAESRGSRISASGGQVLFESRASNLVAGDTNVHTDVFVHELASGVTDRVSLSSAGVQSFEDAYHGDLSIDGRLATFHSNSGIYVVGDTNGSSDVFLRDRGGSPGDITLDGGGLVYTGSSLTFSWTDAPTAGQWWLVRSFSNTGATVFGHVFDVGAPSVILSNGFNAPSGNGLVITAPIPPSASGLTVYFEVAARDLGGVWHDSNLVMAIIL